MAPHSGKNKGQSSSTGLWIAVMLILLGAQLVLLWSTAQSKRKSGSTTAGKEAVEFEGMVVLSRPGELLQKKSCKKMLWISGLQVSTPSGGPSHYLDNAMSYMRYYAAALKSAKLKAPSLAPVLVLIGYAPPSFVTWVEQKGVLVIQHSLTFQDRMDRARAQDPANPKLARLEHLVASYARWDVPEIVRKVRLQMTRSQVQVSLDEDYGDEEREELDLPGLDYVLWTDPDVLFEKDIDSCSLPKPRLLSIGAEVIPGAVENCGVVHYNVPNYHLVQEKFLDFADRKGWEFQHDQQWFRLYFKRWMVNALPDSFNYKPYWGDKEFRQPPPLFPEQDRTEIIVLHTHGPKPKAALCVIDYITAHKLPVKKQREVVLDHLDDILQSCHLEALPWPDVMVQLAAAAAVVDGGLLYRRVLETHNTLCPDVCWEPGSVQHGELGGRGAL